MPASRPDPDDDEHDKGETPDTVHRGCTDVPCLAVLAATLFGLVYVFSYALANGRPENYAGLPTPQGEFCGVSAAVKDKPYLFFCKGQDGKLSYSSAVCVSSCAEDGCGGGGAAAQYLSAPWAGLLCLPDNSGSQDLVDESMELLTSNDNVRMLLEMRGLTTAWPILLGSAGVAVVAGFAFLFLVEKCAGVLVWMGIAVLVSSTACFGGLMVYVSTEPGGLDHLPGTGDTQRDLAVGSAALGFSVVCLLVVCCKRASLNTAIDCVKSAAECMEDTPSLLLEPLVSLAVKTTLCVVLTVGFVYLVATAKEGTVSLDKGIQLEYSAAEKGYLVFYIVTWAWLLELSNSVSSYAIAYAAEMWFFKRPGALPVLRGYASGLSFHAGSLAMGAFAMMVFRFVRMALQVLTEAMKESGNVVGTCVACCCSCIVEILYAFFDKLRHYAYMDIAMNGNPFCTAAGHAMQVITHNATSVFLLNGATLLFELAGAGSITAAGGLATYLVATRMEPYNDPGAEEYIQDPVTLCVVSAVICLLVAIPFMLVFSMVADSVLFCFALERSRTPLQEERAGFMTNFAACWAHAPTKKGELPGYDGSRHGPGTQTLLSAASKADPGRAGE